MNEGQPPADPHLSVREAIDDANLARDVVGAGPPQPAPRAKVKPGCVALPAILVLIILAGWIYTNHDGAAKGPPSVPKELLSDDVPESTGSASNLDSSSSSDPAVPVAANLDGTYTFTSAAEPGSDAVCKTSGVSEFQVTVTGTDPNRTINLLVGASGYSGSLSADNSFQTSGPSSGGGSDVLVGAFDATATPISLEADDTLTGTIPGGSAVTCAYHLTGHKL
jgi:hypothetical protein